MRVGKVNSVWDSMLESVRKNEIRKVFRTDYTDEIFRTVKVIRNKPRPTYELEDLSGTLIEGLF